MVNKTIKGFSSQKNSFAGEKIYLCLDCKKSFISKLGIFQIFSKIKCPHCGSNNVTDKTIKY